VVRRAWGPQGEELRQRQDLGQVCFGLMLAADPITGAVDWHWLPPRVAGLTQQRLLPVFYRWREAGIRAVVWDNAPSHRGGQVQRMGELIRLALIRQPSNSPELNPIERLFQALRASIEGRTYQSLDVKKSVAEAQLNQWAAHPEDVKRLIDWSWIHRALVTLPPSF
jgi:transposase